MESNEFMAGMAVIGVIFLVAMLIALAMCVIVVVCQWKLFTKAGEPGWAAIIPIYNTFVMSKIAFGNYNWAFVFLALWIVQMIISVMQNVLNVIDSDIVVIFVLLISLLSIVVSIAYAVVSGIITFFFSKSYGKSTAWNVLMIFFSPIMLIIMALDKNTEYVGPSNLGDEWFDKIKSKF